MKPKASTRRSRFRHKLIYASNSIVFLVALAFGSWMLGKIDFTPPEIPVISTKLRTFEQDKNEYNAIFIGSSLTYRHIIPQLFDRLMQESGHDIKSFNFGIYAMKLPEQRFFMEKILKNKPNLDFVFIEMQDLKLHIIDDNLRTDREIYWHTWQNTSWVYQLIARSGLPNDKKIKRFHEHTVALTYNLLNLGKGNSAIKRSLNAEEKIVHIDPGLNMVFGSPGSDGYLAIDDETHPIFERRHQYYLDRLKSYRRRVAFMKKNNREKNYKPIQPHEVEIIELLIKAVKDSGAKPIFVIHPVLNKQRHLIEAQKQGHIPILFAFNDPVAFPELYRVNRRFDREHLNDRGAQEFTKLLAQQFADYLEGNYLEVNKD